MTAITVELIGDWKKLQNTFRQVDQESQTLGKRLSSTFDNVGRTFQRVGGAMTLGVTAPLLAFAKQAVGTASDVVESQSKVDQVFGNSAKEISKWASGGAHDFGLAKGAALDAAGSFGNMFDQLGFSAGAAANMSTSLVELNADFASFHNADISEVIAAQEAAFRGEYDALQRFLPLINAASVEQKAMEQTGKANADQLTAQDKAAAVYALTLEGAGKAQGDFDRTSSGLANTQRILAAQWSNIQETLGTVLLPIITKMAGRVSEWASRLEGLNAAQAELAVKIGAVVAAVGPGLVAFGTLLRAISGIGLLLTPAGLVIGGIAALAAGLLFAYKRSETFRNTVNSVFKSVREVVGSVVAKLVDWFGKGGPVETFLQENRGFFRSTWNAIVGIIKAAADLIRVIVGKVAERVREIWKEHGDTIMRVVRIAWDAVKEIIRGALRAIRGVIDLITAAIEGDWGDVWRAIKKILDGVWDAMFGIVRATVRAIATLIGNWLRDIRDRFVSRLKTIATTVSSWWFVFKLLWSNSMENIRTTVRDKIQAIVNFFKGLPGRIATAAKDLASTIKRKIQDVIGGIAATIKLNLGFGDGLGIGMTPGTGSGSLLGVSPSSAVGRAYSALGRPGDVISGLRPGARTLSGALSYHARGRALDITPIASIAHAFRRAFGPRILELITPWRSLDLWHGRPHYYSSAVHAQHSGSNAHIHVAMREGGYGTVTKPTTFLAGEAGAEDFAFVPHSKGGMVRASVTPVVNVHVTAILNGKDIVETVHTVVDAREELSFVRSVMGG